MIKRVVYGPVNNEAVEALTDINRRELVLLAGLAGVVVLFGVYPAPLLDVMEPSLNTLLRTVLATP
jgi:NADH-quinone oxidoreductase subunit M